MASATTPRLLFFQSLWAMEPSPPGGAAEPLETILDRIKESGFDGVATHFYDPATVTPLMAALAERGLQIEGQVFPQTIDDLKPALELAARFGCHHLTLQADVRPRRVAEAVCLLDGWAGLGREAGIDVNFETHRNRITNDLLFTLDLLDALPDLRLTIDLSHYVVAREIYLPISDETEAMIRRVIGQGWALHGRVATAHQVQVPLSFPQHLPYVAQFIDWWALALADWHRRAAPGASLSFLCELGPQPYAISGANGQDISDRWAEALMMRDAVRARWNAIMSST
ncbi:MULTISPECIES: sugar phosphate isomerase/epimerase [unclassified Acidisoma]|uniref:sugar phosphate isomerase/epimerase family protein n=1 Tax=unclassified Acidisoma TaxID=2634065 RepID=UPI00131CF032|nr:MULTISPECIES: TIM barrel protein [unclassified Acidisoma]